MPRPGRAGRRAAAGRAARRRGPGAGRAADAGRHGGRPRRRGRREDRSCRKEKSAAGLKSAVRQKKNQAGRLAGKSGPMMHTQVGRPGDPATRRPGDPATRRPGDPATRRPGDPATRRPGDPATRRPGDPATRRPGDPATRPDETSLIKPKNARNKPRNPTVPIVIPHPCMQAFDSRLIAEPESRRNSKSAQEREPDRFAARRERRQAQSGRRLRTDCACLRLAMTRPALAARPFRAFGFGAPPARQPAIPTSAATRQQGASRRSSVYEPNPSLTGLIKDR